MASCASKVHRASGPGRDKFVLICMLARSLAFHDITFERCIFTILRIKPFGSFFGRLLLIAAEIMVTYGRTDGMTNQVQILHSVPRVTVESRVLPTERACMGIVTRCPHSLANATLSVTGVRQPGALLTVEKIRAQ